MFWHGAAGKQWPHPCVIASDPQVNCEEIVVVKLSSSPGLDEDPGYVDRGESLALSHRSYVRCEDANVCHINKLKLAHEINFIVLHLCLDEAVLKRVHAALGRSRHTKGAVKRVLRTQGFIE